MTSSEQIFPNILVIMADQMTPFVLGAYGHAIARTPNIDALARRGVAVCCRV